MTVAFVAPSPSEGADAMMSLGSLRRGRSALSLPERLGDGNRVRSVFGDDSGLRSPSEGARTR